jgi:hypothetical protein
LSDLCDARLNLDDPMGLQRLYLQEQFFVRPAGEASDRGRSGRQGDQVSAKRLEVGLKWEEGTAAFEGATLDCHDDIAKWTICKPLARYGAWGEPETPVRTFEDKWLGLHWRLTFDMSGGCRRGQPAGNRPLHGRVRAHHRRERVGESMRRRARTTPAISGNATVKTSHQSTSAFVPEGGAESWRSTRKATIGRKINSATWTEYLPYMRAIG